MRNLILALLMLSTVAFGSSQDFKNDEIKILAHIEKTKNSLTPLDKKTPQSVPFKLENKDLNKVIQNLKANEDVLLQGYISQEKTFIHDKISLTPVFIITEIRPVSLEKLGSLGKFEIKDPQITLTHHQAYSPKSIPISENVFASITITASILLLKGLTNLKTSTRLEEDSENLMIFSVGALATGTQVFEDLARKK